MKLGLLPARVLALAASITIGAVLSAGCSGSTEGLFGRELYNKTCEACHGSAGQGSTAGTPLGAGSAAVDLTDLQIRGAIEVGPGSMPGYRRFTPEQLDSLVAFIRDLQTGAADGE